MESNDRMDRIEATLERIGEKHEALAQTVEIIAGMQKVNEAKITALTDGITALTDGIMRLLHVAEIHEQRITDLEGGGQ